MKAGSALVVDRARVRNLFAFAAYSPGETRRKTQLGRSLLELVITVAIIGIVATVAIPASEPKNELTLSLASGLIADAVRFSREQASLTGNMYGITVDTNQQELLVFRLDQTLVPPEPVFDVYHPVSKQLYSIQFAATPFEALTIFEPRAKTSVLCTDSSGFVFESQGVVHCIDPLVSRVLEVSIAVELEGAQGSVVVDGYTGRVYEP